MLQNIIESVLQKNQNRILFADKKNYRTAAITGKELIEKINKTRIFLKKQKINKKDKIIILGQNSREWLIVFFASILSGIVVVPLDVFINKPLLRKIQSEVKAKAIFRDKNLPSLPIKTFFLDELHLIEDIKKEKIQKIKYNKNDIIEILYTSGTTATPKGVILTNENFTTAVNSAIKNTPLIISLKILLILPLSHIYAQIYGIFLPFYYGCRLFFLDSIQPNRIITTIRNKGINVIITVPAILELLKNKLENKRVRKNLGAQFFLIGVGGATLDIELEKFFCRKGFLVLQGYGLTETTSVVSVSFLFKRKSGSVGKIVKEIDLKLGRDDEILVKGKTVTIGYYKDQQKTKQAFKAGWFKTGDIGYEKNGYLYIKDRKKDIIVNASGLNIYPSDIEKELNKIDNVEGCVIEKDKKIHAVLLLKKEINPKVIIKKANSQLLPQQKITSYSIWPYPEFPKTQLGKIKKFIVINEFKKKPKKGETYSKQLYNIISRTLKPAEKIKSDSYLIKDLNMDSLKRIQLVSEIENNFGIELDESELTKKTKVADLEKIMKKEQKSKKILFKKWPLNPINTVIRRFLQKLVYFPIIRFFTRTKYIGLENIKNIKTPVIIASNHQSAFDVPVLIKKLKIKTACAADSDYVFGIGPEKSLRKKAYKKFTGFFTTMFFNAYPFGQTISINTSLEFTGELLDKGYSIILFPEAQRTRNGKMQQFMPGIGFLALNMDVPIVPVKIQGLFEILPAGKKMPKFGKSSIKFGKPLMPEKLKDLSSIRITKLIENTIREL